MGNITKAKQRIIVGKTKMYFSHKGKTLTAVHPFYGPEYSRSLQNLIKKEGYVEPTSAQLTSLVHEYFNGDELQAQQVNQIMGDRYFRGFTGILYVPEKGALGKGLAHFIDYPEFDEKSVVNRDNLLERLNESRAQVPFEHLKHGPIGWRKVAKNPYFVAWAGGEEGAEKLAELASKHSNKEAYIWLPDISNLEKPIARVATLDSYIHGDKLSVGSYDLGYGRKSHAFGVLR